VKGKRKVLVVVNDLKRALEHEWFVTYIDRNSFVIEFLLINSENSAMDTFLKNNRVVTHHMRYHGKSDIPKLFFKMFWLFMSRRYDVIHTHLFISSLIGLPAAWLAGIRTRIMTRHHSDYHHVWFPSAVKYDRFANHFATKIVAISRNVQSILVDREGVSPGKVELVYHGIDFSNYVPLEKNSERVVAIRNKYNITPGQKVIGVVSRFTEWKGVQYIIPAFQELIKIRPDAILILANASGDFAWKLDEMLKQLPEKNFRIIKFETDIIALFTSFDVFIHVPVSASAEAFGQIYLESMALKIPSVFTSSGVLAEYGKDNVNCHIVPFCDSEAIFQKVVYVLDHPEKQIEIMDNAFNEVRQHFSFDVKIKKFMNLYQ